MSPQQSENRTSSLPVTCASFTKDKKSHKPQAANKTQVEKLPRTQLSVYEDSAAPPPGPSAFPRRGCTKLPPIPTPSRKPAVRRNGLSCCVISRQKEKEAASNPPRADRGRPVKLPPLSNPEKGLKNCLKIVSSWDWNEWSAKGQRHQKTPEEEEVPSSVSPQSGSKTSRLPVMCTSSSKEKKVAGNYKLQTAKHQVEKLQSSLHPNSDAFAAAGPLQPAPPPKKNPPPKAVLRRGRLSRSTKHKAEATHNFQKTDSVNLEKLLPLPIPEEALDRSFEMLGSDDWQKKVEGLKWIQALAQHNPNTLMVKLPKVCLAVIDEIKNLRSLVDSVAMDTMVYLYVYLQRNMDAYAESTGRALLLKLAQASSNLFTQQRANTALGSLVQNCSPGRVLNALLNTGLSHLSVPVRTSTAQNLHFLSDIMGTDSILKAGQPFNQRFLSGVSKMCVDPSAGVRVHGHALLQKLSLRPDFMKLWTHMVPERDRRPIEKFLKTENRPCPR
ncbi:uncharacterized protein LOC142903764 [Nelusetta ayraudi]|uniref:uncharacterized protein LOC142903764 n=1 Tax=Nelusetta ayraudi TaxID=303726 RepID=UPI003F70CD41